MTTTNEKNRKKPTLAQTIDQVMTIKTHAESSKTELSSKGKRPFEVKKSESLVGSFWFLINPMHCGCSVNGRANAPQGPQLFDIIASPS